MVRFVVITDTHATTGTCEDPARRGALAEILLLRAVRRINRFIKPDLVLLLGDVAEGGNQGIDMLRRMRAVTTHLAAPLIAIPGNHDADPNTFYTVFDRPPDFLEVNGVRFVPFIDNPEPGYNASRPEATLKRFTQARAGFNGPIAALQHVPLFTPGASDCPYNYLNAESILDAMRQQGVTFSISGHYHRGMDALSLEGLQTLAAPALSIAPFPFLEITLHDNASWDIRRHTLAPSVPGLVDTHVHTPFAYCSENMDIPKAMELAEAYGLAGIRFTEHTGQLYFDRETFWNARFLDRGIDGARPEDLRFNDYLAAVHAANTPKKWIGLEVDCDYHGRAVIPDAARPEVSFLNGAMHWIPEFQRPNPDLERAGDEFLAMVEHFLQTGINVLAHPFRVFHRIKTPPPERLFDPLVRMLLENNVAAEINFHVQTPSAEFIRRCINAGVKISLGSDSHNLYEVGELQPHLDLIAACGYNGPLDDILLPGLRE